MRAVRRKTLLSFAAFVAFSVVAGPARAQGVAANDTAGFYLGAFAGYANGSYQSAVSPSIDHEPAGQFAGVRAGWNRSVGSFVFGAEADVALASVDGDDSITVSGFKSDVSHDINYLSTVRARVGGIAGRAMIYGTAGLALADLDNQLVVSASGNEVGRDEEGSRHTGWAAGAGLEFAITQRMSLTAEYLHIDMREEEVRVNIGGFPFTDEGDLDLNTFRFGVNFRF
jgi:outer membrane immunogenic protein